MQSTQPSLFQCFFQQFKGNTFDLQIQLDSRDTIFSAGHFEVHITQVIFRTEDITQDSVAFSIQDQAHGNTGHVLFQWTACIHEGQ